MNYKDYRVVTMDHIKNCDQSFSQGVIIIIISHLMSSILIGEEENLSEVHNSRASYSHDTFHSFLILFVTF